jgi:hypothetical protein
MLDFNNIKYEVKGDTIILNKKDLFQNREVALIQEQSCLTWNDAVCDKFSEPVCLTLGEPTCKLWEERKPINCLKLENPEERFDPEKNPCLEWEDWKAVGCLEFDEKKGECLKWEKELSCLEFNPAECSEWSKPECLNYLPKTCKTWTNYTKDDFVKQAIQKELEFVKGVQIQRANRTITQADTNGKILIK